MYAGEVNSKGNTERGKAINTYHELMAEAQKCPAENKWGIPGDRFKVVGEYAKKHRKGLKAIKAASEDY